MPDHETVKYAKDALTVGLLTVVSVYLILHFVRGGSLRHAAMVGSSAA